MTAECDKLICGDCLEVMPTLPDNSVDLILTDLPYGTTNCAWDEIIPFDTLWRQFDRIAKSKAAVVLFAAQPFTTKLISSNFRHFKYLWYWHKNNVTGFTFAKYQPMRCVEDICVFYRQMPTYNPQGLRELEQPIERQKKSTAGGVYKSDTLQKQYKQRYTGYPRNLLDVPNEVSGNRRRLHPTQKPVALMEYLIRTYTNEGDTVLDCCIGSGTTCVACANTGRQFIGIERDERYYRIARERVMTEGGNACGT